MRATFAVLLAGSILTGAGLAQQSTITKGMLNPDAPIALSANDMAADEKAGVIVYNGNVIVHQGEVKMRANTMRAKLTGNKPSRITALGKVVIDAPSGVATGDNGVYDVGPRIITLTGNVVLTKQKNVMRGHQLVVNLITGLATFGGEPGKPGRVQALFTPSTEGATQNP